MNYQVKRSFQELKREFEKRDLEKKELHGGPNLEEENILADLWILLTEMSQEDIAKLSLQDQKWREKFIDLRKNLYFFQQITNMRDPNYEEPPPMPHVRDKNGALWAHPAIVAQLINQVPELVRNCPICKEEIRVQLTESQWAISRDPSQWASGHDPSNEIVDEHMASHILEHHPDTETAKKIISNLKTIDSKPVVSKSLPPQPIKSSKLTCPTCNMVFEYNALATVCPNCLGKLE